MSKLKHKLHSAAEHIHMREGERSALRAFAREMVNAPEHTELSLYHATPSPFMMFAHIRRVAVATLAVLVVWGTGFSYAAEKALPGDLLYPVKVSVNEEIRSAFAFGVEHKAQWEAERAARRLEEATKLAMEGELDAGTHAEIQERLKEHNEKVLATVRELEEEDKIASALALKAEYEARVQSQNRVLARVSENQDDQSRARLASLSADVEVVHSELGGELVAAVDVGAGAGSVSALSMLAPDERSSVQKDDGTDEEYASVARSQVKKAASALKEAQQSVVGLEETADTLALDSDLETATTLLNDSQTALKEGRYKDAFEQAARARVSVGHVAGIASLDKAQVSVSTSTSSEISSGGVEKSSLIISVTVRAADESVHTAEEIIDRIAKHGGIVERSPSNTVREYEVSIKESAYESLKRELESSGLVEWVRRTNEVTSSGHNSLDVNAEEFRSRLLARLSASGQMPIEGYTASLLIASEYEFVAQDFHGVEALQGVYTYSDGMLSFTENTNLIHSAANTISSRGYKTLFKNIATRFSIDAYSADAVERVLSHLKTSSAPVQSTTSTSSPSRGTSVNIDTNTLPEVGL